MPVGVRIPPLRERREYIAPLADHFRETIATSLGIRPSAFTTEAYACLESLPFRGNARELRNTVERVFSPTSASEIGREEILATAAPREDPKAEDAFSRTMPLVKAKTMLEERFIRA